MDTQDVLEKVLEYLPHKVEIRILNHKSDYVGIERAEVNGYYMLNDKPHFTYKGGSTGKSVFEIRFLLKPLSELDKEVEPGVKYKDLLDDNDLSWLSTGWEGDWKNLSYRAVNFLRKNLFDIDGLIEAGIAEELSQI